MKKTKAMLSLVLAVVLVMTLLLTGCGDKGNANTDADNSANTDNNSSVTTVGEEASDEWGTYTKLSDDVKPITLVYGGDGGPTSITWAASSFLKELLETRSDGKITLDVHENSTIGSNLELYEGVVNGDIDLCNGSPGSTFIADAAASDVLMLFTDWDKAWEMWTDSPFRDMLNEMFADQGVTLLWASPKSYRDYHGNVKLSSISDAKGLTIRLPGNVAWVNFWTSIGASPQSIAMSEVFTALQQKTVDAGENSSDQILNNNLLEVSDYLIFTDHYLDTMGLMMNTDRYEGLDPEIRTLFDQCMEAYAVWCEETVPEYLESEREQLVEAADASGCEVLEISDEFRQELTDAALDNLDYVRGISDRASQLLDLALDFFGYEY